MFVVFANIQYISGVFAFLLSWNPCLFAGEVCEWVVLGQSWKWYQFYDLSYYFKACTGCRVIQLSSFRTVARGTGTRLFVGQFACVLF